VIRRTVAILILAALALQRRRAPEATCAAEQLALCRRIEAGEPPGKAFNTTDPETALVRLRACTTCGSFRRIETELIPAGERIARTFRDFRASRPRAADCGDEQKRACDRVEAGEPAPTVYAIPDRGALAMELRRCRRCGGYPRIEVIIAELETPVTSSP
jgi:hypothetical protein